MPRFKDQAIVIRLLDWSETSQVAVFLTGAHGKVAGLAKGAKRTSPSAIARFSGGFDLLTVGELVGIIKPTTSLANITEWDLQDNLRHLRTDLRANHLGLYAADLVHAMFEEHDKHPRTFAALHAYLRALAEPTDADAALLRFQWDLLCDAGYKPRLGEDVRTGQSLPRERTYTFDPVAGGFTAEPSADRTWRVRRETVDLLASLSSGDATPLAGRDPASLDRANRLLCVYARAILDRELPTMRFLLG